MNSKAVLCRSVYKQQIGGGRSYMWFIMGSPGGVHEQGEKEMKMQWLAYVCMSGLMVLVVTGSLLSEGILTFEYYSEVTFTTNYG